MDNHCSTVIFSDKAYNELIRESFSKHPVETGGLLLGYVVNDTWVVMEVVPPGHKGIHETAYFEYDVDFVNYLIPTIANRYKDPLQLLGLWHRHPGSMDFFSSTDDETNSEFASRSRIGTISGLVNIDPNFRLTMYHLDHFTGPRPRNVAYSKVDVEVGDDFIPEEFFALRYIDGENSNLHPAPTGDNTQTSQTHSAPRSPRNGGDEAQDLAEKAESRNAPKTDEAAADAADNTTKTDKAETPAAKPSLWRKLLPWGIAAVAMFAIYRIGYHFGQKASLDMDSISNTEELAPPAGEATQTHDN